MFQLSLIPSTYKHSKKLQYTSNNKPLRIAVDLRNWDSNVDDQKEIGSCVGNAIANSYELLVNKNQPTFFSELSRLFIYYNSRISNETTDVDVGSSLYNGLQGVKDFGICKEELWPYIQSNVNIKPSDECYVEGKHRSILNYKYLANVNEVVNVINDNNPVVAGFMLYEDFLVLSSNNPILSTDQSLTYIGNHAMSIVGYNLMKKQLLAKNSFGESWGDKGYCYIPFEYVQKNMFEAWCFNITNQSTKF